MKLKKGKNSGGFSLIEVLAAISIMAIVIGPICAGLVVSARLNARCETLLQDQLAVKSAVETLMAEGVQAKYDTENEKLVITNGEFSGLTLVFAPYVESESETEGEAKKEPEYSETNLPIAYKVTVKSSDDRLVVDTIIRATEAPADTTKGGEGGA